MSLAEEMLANMSVIDDSSTYLAEEEPHIVINESRQAIVPNELKTIAVTGDKDIETVTFDCVRYWDGNDLSTFAIYLNYVLPDLTTGTYIPEKITTTDGDEFYHFDWKIKNNITVKSGKISFAVTAVKTKQNENGETVVDKQWSSLPNGDCSIALGIDISNVPSEEESSNVLAQMSAILGQIQEDFDEWLKNNLPISQTTGESKTAVMSQKATTDELDGLNNTLANRIEREYTLMEPSEVKESHYLTTGGICSPISAPECNVYIYDVVEGDKINGVFFSDYGNAFYALYCDENMVEHSDNLQGAGMYMEKEFVIPSGVNKLYVYTHIVGDGFVSYNIIRKYTEVLKVSEPMPTNGLPKLTKAVEGFVFGDVYQYESGKPLKKVSHNDQSGLCIAVKGGETYIISGFENYSWHLYYIVDANQNVIPFTFDNEWKWYSNIVVRTPENAVAMYINSVNTCPTTIKKVIDWEIGNNITGKKLVFDGDSICESRTVEGNQTYNGGGFAKIIADKYYATYDNRAVGGGILTSAVGTGISAHSISDNTSNLPTDGDLYCFDGGINDYWNNCTLGDFSPNDYTTELDTNTVCGALEYIFKFCIEHFVGKAICFVITHKISDTFNTPNAKGDTWKDYHDKIVGICEKYSIPYYDAYLHSGLNGWNTIQSNAYLTAGSNATPTSGDGCHPNEEGYRRYYVGQLTDLFDRILRVE